MIEICNNRVTSVSMHGVLHVCRQVFSWVTLEAVDRTFVYLSDFLSSYYTGMIVLLFIRLVTIISEMNKAELELITERGFLIP